MNLNCPPESLPHLVYTAAFDAPGSESYRFLAKMLASSLVRTYFPGDVVVFRNSLAPLFQVERKGLHEVYLETPPLSGQAGAPWAAGHTRLDLDGGVSGGIGAVSGVSGPGVSEPQQGSTTRWCIGFSRSKPIPRSGTLKEDVAAVPLWEGSAEA